MTWALVAPLSTVTIFRKCSLTCFLMAGEMVKLRPVNSIFISRLLCFGPVCRERTDRQYLWLVERSEKDGRTLTAADGLQLIVDVFGDCFHATISNPQS